MKSGTDFVLSGFFEISKFYRYDNLELHFVRIALQTSGLEKQLTVAIAAEIGGADVDLTTFLARLELEQLLSRCCAALPRIESGWRPSEQRVVDRESIRTGGGASGKCCVTCS
jgi:hypothetical protein